MRSLPTTWLATTERWASLLRRRRLRPRRACQVMAAAHAEQLCRRSTRPFSSFIHFHLHTSSISLPLDIGSCLLRFLFISYSLRSDTRHANANGSNLQLGESLYAEAREICARRSIRRQDKLGDDLARPRTKRDALQFTASQMHPTEPPHLSLTHGPWPVATNTPGASRPTMQSPSSDFGR